MEIQTEKFCENCNYFCQHYFKSNQGKLIKVFGDGHCINNKLTKAVSRKHISKYLACEFWEAQEHKIDAQREGVIKVIFEMRKTLKDIASVLQDD
ncbi:MAG: hypothetical protein K2O89_06120 [Clostridia bacterium]|nr:hypothetical protein [Clostridia bacterium]